MQQMLTGEQVVSSPRIFMPCLVATLCIWIRSIWHPHWIAQNMLFVGCLFTVDLMGNLFLKVCKFCGFILIYCSKGCYR